MNYMWWPVLIVFAGYVIFRIEDWRSNGFLTKRGWTKIGIEYRTHGWGSNETIETWVHDKTGEVRRESHMHDAHF